MFVVKRDGHKEPIMFDKITARIKKLCYDLNPLVDPVRVAMRVIEGLYDGVTTSELDNLASEIAATMTTSHPDYAQLAARISVSNLHKNTKKSFSETMSDLYQYVNPERVKMHLYCLMRFTILFKRIKRYLTQALYIIVTLDMTSLVLKP